MKCVAPLAGAWIEIPNPEPSAAPDPVAPLAGAWIEITTRYGNLCKNMSLPSRERGLK